jgi:uncharacterized iron-regulated protein
MINISIKKTIQHLILPLFLSVLVSTEAKSQLYQGSTLKVVDPSAIVSKVKPGSILILGENHGLASNRDQHVQLLNLLRASGLTVSVGLEFLNYPDQTFVNQYLSKEINDEQFLSIINWQGFDFQFYKQQILFPNIDKGETTLALNMPRSITSKISKSGLESLTPDEQKLMPPQFHLGRDSYKQRFSDIMHVPVGPMMEKYFAAQSTWDDTMAYTATEFMKQHPNQVLVIIVGEFHAQYGGGLADRILARAPGLSVVSLSQIWAVNQMTDGTVVPMTDEEIMAEIKPSEKYGPRNDFIWVSKPN